MKLRSFALAFVLVLGACGGDDQPAPDAASNCPADTPPASPTPPAPRAFMAGGYDSTTTSIYVFGGDLSAACGSTTPQPANDTWRYFLKCTSWIQLNPSTPPPARSGAANVIAKISATGGGLQRHLYVFGGRGDSQLYNDVWALDLDTFEWAPVATTGTPPDPREHATLAFNRPLHKLLLFGGNTSMDAAAPALQNDVWELDLDHGNTWTKLTTAGTPPAPRMMHIAQYDSDAQQLYVGFGQGMDGSYFGNLYALDQTPQMTGPPPNQWKMGGSSTIAPSARTAPGAAYDTSHGRLLIYGGRDANLGPLNDLWMLSGGRWTLEVAPDVVQDGSGQFCQRPADYVSVVPVMPERRLGALWVWGDLGTTSGGNPFLFGGTGDCGALNDVWGLLEGQPPQWAPLEMSQSGVSCAHAGTSGCASLCQ